MSKYFDLFPQIFYGTDTYKQLYTNILVRMRIVDKLKNNISSYYEFVIPENETIEMVAERIYGNAEYHWIIALTNDMVDPLMEWPKDHNTIIKYIKTKYGSISNASNQIHHYEKKIERRSQDVNYTDTFIYNIDKDYYDDNAHYEFTNWTLSNGITVTEEINLSAITCYDWELEDNDRKRNIKIIKKDYLNQIISEFNSILEDAGSTAIKANVRTLRNY